jgi:Protein of unknwon function (DUF3310)
MVSCEKVLTSDRTAEEESYLERIKKDEIGQTVNLVVPPKYEIDNVNHPPHYNNSPAKCECGRRIECIDVTRHYPFNIGNAIKYLWRYEQKEGITSLKKAIWYIQDAINEMEKNGKTSTP